MVGAVGADRVRSEAQLGVAAGRDRGPVAARVRQNLIVKGPTLPPRCGAELEVRQQCRGGVR